MCVPSVVSELLSKRICLGPSELPFLWKLLINNNSTTIYTADMLHRCIVELAVNLYLLDYFDCFVFVLFRS